MRRTLMTLLSAIALIAVGVVGAFAVGGTGTVTPPPKIAFLANGINPADAVAAGSIAGQLGAPVFTTRPDSLETAAKDGIVAYAPELVIALGGPVAISDAVLAALATATGLPIVQPSETDPPEAGIVRAAGETRFDTAAEVATLVAAYAPAFLPVDATALGAVDADQLDGKDSTDFTHSDQACAAGDVVIGVDGQGDMLCDTPTDEIDGGNAATLDGLESSSLVRVGGHSSGATLLGSTSDTHTANTATINAPVDGFLVITSSTEVENRSTAGASHLTDADTIGCDLALDGLTLTDDSRFDILLLATVFDRCPQTFTTAVPAGDHSISVVISGLGPNSRVIDSQLSMIFTPFGSVTPAIP